MHICICTYHTYNTYIAPCYVCIYVHVHTHVHNTSAKPSLSSNEHYNHVQSYTCITYIYIIYTLYCISTQQHVCTCTCICIRTYIHTHVHNISNAFHIRATKHTSEEPNELFCTRYRLLSACILIGCQGNVCILCTCTLCCTYTYIHEKW